MSQPNPPPVSRRTAAAAGGGAIAGVVLLLAAAGVRSGALTSPVITDTPPAIVATIVPPTEPVCVFHNCPAPPVPATDTPTPIPATGAPAPAGRETPVTESVCQPRQASGYAQGAYLPDPFCTPGEAFPSVTTAQLCLAGYARSVRNVPYQEKLDVYRAYGITHHLPGQYEVDHLISLELGGDNAEANLWPEPALPVPGFHEKDLVENWLHQQVCSGSMSLADAQHLIATNWLTAYQEMSLSGAVAGSP